MLAFEDPLFDREWIRSSVGAAACTAYQLENGFCRADAPPVPLRSMTIASLRESLKSKKITCQQVIAAHLDRIDAYDRAIGVNAVISLRRKEALAEAQAYDEVQLGHMNEGEGADEADKELFRLKPLICVPIMVKDNIDVAGLATTGGNAALSGNFPIKDANVVKRLKQAGAIILGKASMSELALFASWATNSVIGETRNPYHLAYTTAGSSSGSAAAVAAGFGVAALGTDTGSSIRGPAAYTATVGLRPTLGLVGRGGLLPVSWQHDTVGPIARTVEDAAALLTVLAGYDPSDNTTYPLLEKVNLNEENHTRSTTEEQRGNGSKTVDYTKALDPGGLRGARIGSYTQMVNMPGTNPEVVGLFNKALTTMSENGATLIEDFRITGNRLGRDWDPNRYGHGPAMGHWSVGMDWLDLWSCHSTLRESFDEYINKRAKERNTMKPMREKEAGQGNINVSLKFISEPDAALPITSLGDLYSSRQFHPLSEDSLVLSLYSQCDKGQEGFLSTGKSIYCGCGTVLDDPCRVEFRRNLIDSMDRDDIDVIVYPSWGSDPLLIGDQGDGYFDGNFSPMIAPHTGAPSITIPMGYTHGGLPAGIQFLARPKDEKTLLKIAYAFERKTKYSFPPPLFKECGEAEVESAFTQAAAIAGR